jgi:hypothetical protein
MQEGVEDNLRIISAYLDASAKRVIRLPFHKLYVYAALDVSTPVVVLPALQWRFFIYLMQLGAYSLSRCGCSHLVEGPSRLVRDLDKGGSGRFEHGRTPRSRIADISAQHI